MMFIVLAKKTLFFNPPAMFNIEYGQLHFCLLNTRQSVSLFSFFFFFPIIETPLSSTGITFRVGVYKDANNSSYLCFDICLLVGGLFLRFFFLNKPSGLESQFTLDCNVMGHAKNKLTEAFIATDIEEQLHQLDSETSRQK